MADGYQTLTVLCLLWRGWRPFYEAQHVNALGRMLHAHLHVPYRFVCCTDMPSGITEAEVWPVWDDPVVPKKPTHHDTWRRLKLFSPWAAEQWPGWLLSLDIDCLIQRDITPMLTFDAPLKILKGAVSRYRAGMFLHQTGTLPHVWTTFDPEKSPWEIPKYFTKGKPWRGSDQAWLSITVPYAPVWTRQDGVLIWNSKTKAQYREQLPDEARIIFTMGEDKPWSPVTKEHSPALYDAYRRWLS